MEAQLFELLPFRLQLVHGIGESTTHMHHTQMRIFPYNYSDAARESSTALLPLDGNWSFESKMTFLFLQWICSQISVGIFQFANHTNRMLLIIINNLRWINSRSHFSTKKKMPLFLVDKLGFCLQMSWLDFFLIIQILSIPMILLDVIKAFKL